MWVNHLCLISEFRDVEEYIKKNLVTDKFAVVIHGEGHWWCKALFIRAIMWVNHLCLIFEFRDVEEHIKKNLVTDKFTVVIHGEGHWWCKALFIRAIMWVNHLCLIFEFRDVEEFVQKNLALTNSQSLLMERMMVQSFLRFICQFAKWIKQSFAPSLHHSLSLKEILQLLKSR